MIRYLDWRDAGADTIQPLYAAECERWRASLDWDYGPSCALLEHARCGRRLPGLLALDGSGRVVGWTYYLLHDSRLQIGTLLGDDTRIERALLERILRTPEARNAGGASCFLYPNVPATAGSLSRAGFTMLGHTYLRRPLAAADRQSTPPTSDQLPAVDEQQPATIAAWSHPHLGDVARLLESAYEGMPESVCFAPASRPEEWVAYVATLVQTRACGRFCPALSATARTRTGEVVAALIATAVSDRTAHIAQVAVAPEHRGRHLGERLVALAFERARQAGYGHVSLLVADSNTVARRLYDRLGFEPVAPFLFAYRDSPPCSRWSRILQRGPRV